MNLTVLCVLLPSVGCTIINEKRPDGTIYKKVQFGAIPPPCHCGRHHYHWDHWFDCNGGRRHYGHSPYPYRGEERRVIGKICVDVN